MSNWEKEISPLIKNRLNEIGEVTQEEKRKMRKLEDLDSILSGFFKGDLEVQMLMNKLKEMENDEEQLLLRYAYNKLKDSFKWKGLPIKFKENDNGILSISFREVEAEEKLPVLEITDNNFDEMVRIHPVLVVDCWADWCAPCRLMAPVIEELAEDYSGKITFGKLNIDINDSATAKYQIMSIPTFLIFKNGQIVGQMVGAMTRKMLEAEIIKFL